MFLSNFLEGMGSIVDIIPPKRKRNNLIRTIRPRNVALTDHWNSLDRYFKVALDEFNEKEIDVRNGEQKKLSNKKPKQPLEKKEQPASQTNILQASARYSGPIPPPVVMEQYNNIISGSADRILIMAEKQEEHIHHLEKRAFEIESERDEHDYKERRLGQICGLIIGLFTIGCATYAGLNGAEITGSVIGGSGVVGLVSAFIYGRRSKEKEPIAKDDDKSSDNS